NPEAVSRVSASLLPGAAGCGERSFLFAYSALERDLAGPRLLHPRAPSGVSISERLPRRGRTSARRLLQLGAIFSGAVPGVCIPVAGLPAVLTGRPHGHGQFGGSQVSVPGLPRRRVRLSASSADEDEGAEREVPAQIRIRRPGPRFREAPAEAAVPSSRCRELL